jgi:hypothetical protein
MDNRLSNTGSCEPLVSIVFIIKISIWSILTLIGSEIGEDYKELTPHCMCVLILSLMFKYFFFLFDSLLDFL